MFNNPFSMVVAIVLIVTIGRVLSAKYGVVRTSRSRNRGETFVGQPQPDPEVDRQREEIKALKERIAVLERLATDNHSAAVLDREIEKLR